MKVGAYLKTKNLIIGGGITGLTYASYTDNDFLIVEKENEVGGYCRTIYCNEFVWDFAGHFFHFKTEEFKQKFLHSLSPNKYVKQYKKTYVYYDKKLIDYPFQMNIHQLKQDEFIDCLYDLFNKEEKVNYDNFLDMLYGKFGKSIVEKFLKPYNEKLYACDLKKLDKNAMGRFFPYADISSIINNMKKNSNSSYNDTFLYPKKGAKVIIDFLMANIDSKKVLLNTTIIEIDIINKIVKLNNGDYIEYENLINTIPFNRFLKLLNNNDYINFSNQLTYNKVLVFNMGFNKKSKFNKEHWIYFPDKKTNFYRVGFYDNILNTNKLSMYIEIGYEKNANIDINKQLEITLENLKKINIIDDSYILEEHMSIIMDPAYVHINSDNDKKIKHIIEHLNKNKIYSIGRYGSWTYCSMEDSMIQAKELAESINR